MGDRLSTLGSRLVGLPVPADVKDERQSEYWANREEEQHQ